MTRLATSDPMTGVRRTGDLTPGERAPRMLVADDDPSIVRAIAARCTRMGFNVEVATNGLQLLLKASRFDPDILVVDVNMPEVDGLSASAHLLDPDKKPLHVVVVTGSRDAETIDRCESLGAYYTHKGLAFWNELKAALIEIYPERSSLIRQVAEETATAEVRARPRVLLVDDDADVREFLGSRLGKFGVDMSYAVDAVEGFRKARREEPTVIIADYFMPNGDAQFLLTRLRTAPETSHIPVIVLTGRELNAVAKQILQREINGHPGAAQILRKSFDTAALFTELQKYCGFAIGAEAGRA